MAKTSPRCASIQGATSDEIAGVARTLTADRLERQTRARFPRAARERQPCIAAIPTRSPVNDPGPGDHRQQSDLVEIDARGLERASEGFPSMFPRRQALAVGGGRK